METASGCNETTRLLATDSSVQVWRANMRECWEMRARLSLASGDLKQAERFAERAVQTAKSVQSTDLVEDRYALAQSYRLLGDIRLRLGDKSGAQAAWKAALVTLPAGVAEKPNEMAEHAILLQRLGRSPEARERGARLDAMDYRSPEFRAT
jgi:tetratricopeptide (TPR) repeat protein